MEVPAHLKQALSDIREGLHFVWNPKAILKKKGGISAEGNVKSAEYEPRFEIWDTDPYGKLYMVMRVQHEDGSFRMPDDRLIEHIWHIHPEKYGGSLNKLVQANIENPEHLRDLGTQKDSDDAIDAAARWAQWCETPKSGPAIKHRGKKLLS